MGNHVCPETEKYLIPPILNFAECLLDVSHKIKELPLKNYTFEDDDGVHYYKTDNPYIKFHSDYRLIRIKDSEGNFQSVGFTVLFDGVPHLFIATYNNNNFHNSLELNLEKYMKVDGEKLYFIHNYVGNKIKKQELKEYVKSKNIFKEDSEGNIILGTLDSSKLLYCDDEKIEELLANLTEYALLRDEYRSIKK